MNGDLVPALVRDVEVCRLTNNRVTLAAPLPKVNHLLEVLRQTGQLVSATTPVPDGRPGIYTVTVRLLPLQRVPEPRRRRGGRFWAVIATVGLSALAAFTWAVTVLVQSIIAAAGDAADAASGAAEDVWHGALGAVVVLGAIVVGLGVGVGKTFSGTFRGKMD